MVRSYRADKAESIHGEEHAAQRRPFPRLSGPPVVAPACGPSSSSVLIFPGVYFFSSSPAAARVTSPPLRQQPMASPGRLSAARAAAYSRRRLYNQLALEPSASQQAEALKCSQLLGRSTSPTLLLHEEAARRRQRSVSSRQRSSPSPLGRHSAARAASRGSCRGWHEGPPDCYYEEARDGTCGPLRAPFACGSPPRHLQQKRPLSLTPWDADSSLLTQQQQQRQQQEQQREGTRLVFRGRGAPGGLAVADAIRCRLETPRWGDTRKQETQETGGFKEDATDAADKHHSWAPTVQADEEGPCWREPLPSRGRQPQSLGDACKQQPLERPVSSAAGGDTSAEAQQQQQQQQQGDGQPGFHDETPTRATEQRQAVGEEGRRAELSKNSMHARIHIQPVSCHSLQFVTSPVNK
ncbi:hypothetical protein Efla_007885 [Eimeria flavescens]